MGKIIHPQKKEIKGPWLLNQEDFETLDIVFEKIDILLYQSWLNNEENKIKQEKKDITEEELSKEIEKKKNESWNYKYVKKCEITSNDESKLSDETILGILKDKTVEKLKPKSFNLNVRHGSIYENSFDLKVSNYYKGALDYDINCSDTHIKDEIQYEIDKWIDKRKPNWALQIWSNYGDFIIYTFIFPIVMFAYNSFSTSYATYQQSLKLEMYELGKVGINETNRDLALELLIKLESGFRPENFELIEIPNNPIWIRLFIVSVFIYIAAVFRPKTMIGLGLIKKKLAIYKVWIKLVLITLPAVLILGPFWKLIVQWFY